MSDKLPAQQIDDIVSAHGGWRGELLSRLRAVITQADPTLIKEEVKWKMPSKPLGVPVWSYSGIISVADVLKNAVRLTFPKGALLHDPDKMFNARLESRLVRAIDFHQDESINEAALRALILEALKLNASKEK